jgi:hypothetical protein
MLKKCRRIGSLRGDFSTTRPSVAMLTTAGVAFFSIGARLGMGSSPQSDGKAAMAGIVAPPINKIIINTKDRIRNITLLHLLNENHPNRDN